VDVSVPDITGSLDEIKDKFGSLKEMSDSANQALTNGASWDSVQVQRKENGVAETPGKFKFNEVEAIDLSWDAVKVTPIDEGEEEGSQGIRTLKVDDLKGFGKLSDLQQEKDAKEALEEEKAEGEEAEETEQMTWEERIRKQKEGQDEAKEKAEAAMRTGCFVLALPVLLECTWMVLELVAEIFGDCITHAILLGFVIFLAEKVLQKHNSEQAESTSPQTFRVQVPLTATPGQMIQTTAPSGMLVQVQVPMNSSPGTWISVEDPGQPKDTICDRV